MFLSYEHARPSLEERRLFLKFLDREENHVLSAESKGQAQLLPTEDKERKQVLTADSKGLDDWKNGLRGLYVFVLFNLLQGVSVDITTDMVAKATPAISAEAKKKVNASTRSTDEKATEETNAQSVSTGAKEWNINNDVKEKA